MCVFLPGVVIESVVIFICKAGLSQVMSSHGSFPLSSERSVSPLYPTLYPFLSTINAGKAVKPRTKTKQYTQGVSWLIKLIG